MHFISVNNLAALVGTSNATVQKWAENSTYPTHTHNGVKGFYMEELDTIPEVVEMLNENWNEEQVVKPIRDYTSVELFAGGGGLALSMSLAGFKHVLLNEFDKYACNTLRLNHPEWNVIEGDVRDVDFTPLRGKIDFCQVVFHAKLSLTQESKEDSMTPEALCDVPKSEGVKYPVKKEKVLKLVPQGGDWRDLPEDVAKDYMGGSWFLGGGKTGMARRLSLDEPSLTLTCSPCQKQTERCHPIETRPLTIREYARIQTFSDNWEFDGTMSDF